MRIQHNIMAMNAYRNYTNNTSALAKNLEKLSSGYRINRAGDDAAGLAISEKMRAQITALGTAQKNVKDGISLVKTAEGATQEIHDMLNRMVDLATQSANGTYQDEVDREAIQEEYEALKTEINRIADSSNFNGIKLLDGSMDAGGEVSKVKGQFQVQADGVTVKDGNIGLPKVGDLLGTDTVLHKGATDAVTTNEFSVELHNLEFSGAADTQITLTIGGDAFTLDAADAGGKLDAAGIAKAFVDGKFKDAGAAAVNKDAVSIGGVNYKVTAEGNKLTFSTEDDATIPATVTVEETTADANRFTAGTAVTDQTVEITPDAGINYTTNTNLTADQVAAIKGAKLNVGGVDIDLSGLTVSTATAANDVAALIQAAITNQLTAANTAGAAGNADYKEFDVTPANLTVAGDATGKLTVTFDYTPKTANAAALTGDYNVSTTDIQAKAPAGDNRLASTWFDLTKEMVTDGSSITIGTKSYTFTTDKNKIGKDGYVDVTDGDLAKIAERLTDEVAKDNTTYTLGFDANRISITEIENQKDFDLTTMAGIEKSLGFTKAVTSDVKDGQGLMLQIGEDSQSYNQLKVSIKDMHTSSLGLDAVNLDTQSNAQAAVDVIKNAINQVSSTRGRLGATQNRLEHTANNLSTMKENIQDAEATIRDTDIAEEMMAYTKNNILVQSAQAMLAQANQIPQGVLQLLG